MITNKLLLTAGIVTLSASFFSTSTLAANANGSATVTVLTPLSIAAGTNGMDFGNVAGDADNSTTVTLSSGGGTTASAGANAAGSPTPGDFDVTGSGTLAYNITVPPAAITLTGVGFGGTMTVDTFETSAGGSSSLTAGSDSFTVGAVLNIGANQAADTYNGTYSMTVEYQ